MLVLAGDGSSKRMRPLDTFFTRQYVPAVRALSVELKPEYDGVWPLLVEVTTRMTTLRGVRVFPVSGVIGEAAKQYVSREYVS